MHRAMTTLCALVVASVAAGCNRSSESAHSQAKPQADAAKAELDKAHAELAGSKTAQVETQIASPPKVDADRRSADWVLRVDGSVRVVVDGVVHELKQGEQLPEGTVKLLAVNLNNCPKATDERRDYLRGLHGLQELSINDGSKIRNFDFLADMTGLRVLNSEGGTPIISDADLTHIQKMKQLKTLIIVSQFQMNDKLTDKVFGTVKELPELENLRVCNAKVAGEGIRQLEGHPTLRTLDFWRSKIEDAQLKSLSTIPQLQNLYLTETPITDNGLLNLRGCPRLRVLHLHGTAVTDAGLDALTGLKLTEVGVRQTKVTEDGARKLENAVPGLKVHR